MPATIIFARMARSYNNVMTSCLNLESDLKPVNFLRRLVAYQRHQAPPAFLPRSLTAACARMISAKRCGSNERIGV